MNQTAHRVLTICIIGLLFYLLVWPFLNSLISGNYYIQAGTEGSQTMSYAVRVNSDLGIEATIENYNNVATESKGDKNTTFHHNISLGTYEKIKSIIGEYSGFHLFARHHVGFAFYYNSNDNASIFYTAEEKTNLFNLAEAMTWLARGEEKVDSKRSSQTYEEKGTDRINEIYASLDL